MAPRSISRRVIVAAAFLSAAVAAAQEPLPQQTPSIVVTPTPTPTPTPIPAPSPTAVTPLVVPATPTPTPTLRPDIDDVPAPIFVANSRPTPIVPPVASPSATPTVAPTSVPTPSPASTARPPIETVILPQEQAIPLWAWEAGGAALLLIILGWVGLRRQPGTSVGDNWDEEAFEQELPSEPAAEPLTTVVDDRAHLSVALRPTRAGLNLISATAECEITLVNIGGAMAENVRATLRLMSARVGQDAELAAFYADAGGRPATPAFSLAPGEERRFRAVTALPHDAIHSIDAAGRPMFVPLVALSVRYRDDEGPRRVGQAFMLGVDQSGSAKLAPFWLDGPARSYDSVAVRPRGEAVED